MGRDYEDRYAKMSPPCCGPMPGGESAGDSGALGDYLRRLF